MPPYPVADNSPKPKTPLRTASTPPLSVSKESPAKKSVEPSPFIPPFSVISADLFNNGEEVDLHFSDQSFTFPTSWLHESRKNEGLPSPCGCKNPSVIRIICVKITGAGIRTMVDITWNTGTVSHFPALWLRVLGPTKALEQDLDRARLPVLGGGNPRSGVGQLTLDEKNVAERYRGMLMETMKEYIDEDWLIQAPTSLLREMVRYVEVELQNEPVAASG